MKNTKINKERIIAILIVVIITSVILSIIFNTFRNMEFIFLNNFGLNAIFILLSTIFSLLMIILVHELGHLFFGKLAKYKLLKCKIGVLTWKYENGKFKFSIEKNASYSGMCSMIPSERELKKYSHLLYFSGGMLMNISVTLIVGIILILNPSFHIYVKEFLMVFTISSLVIVLLNLVPYRRANNPSDGVIIWALINNNKYAENFIKANRIIIYLTTGTRPKDIKELDKDIDEDIDITQGIHEVLHVLYNAIDNNNHNRIKKCIDILENNRSKIPSIIQPGIDSELCYCYCALENKEKAKYYYDKAREMIEKNDDASYNRIKAYYEFYIKNDNKKSLEYCNRGLSVIDKYPIKGIAVMEKDLLMELKEIVSKYFKHNRLTINTNSDIIS